MAARSSMDGFSRSNSTGSSNEKSSHSLNRSLDSGAKGRRQLGTKRDALPAFGRVSSVPVAADLNKESETASGLNSLGIKVQHESDRAKMTIKQVLEQRRLNDATGALVKEFFSSVSPAELQDKIAEIFHEFDTDHNGGLDRDEIGRAFLLVGKPLKDSDVLAWLNEFDADGNGIIDEDEFAHMVRNRMGIACSITCIPCLRGCNSEQRRTKPVKPASKLKALRRPTVTSQFEKKCSPGWAGNQMLMSITERKREMMTNFLTSAESFKASTESGNTSDDTFRRTASAPSATVDESFSAAAQKEEIENIFKTVKRQSLARRVDSQWQDRASEVVMSSATGIMDQLNYFLVAHLKSVPLDKLHKKIRETFATIDLDNSGELNKAEVGAAFERLGKPLSAADLDAYMAMVDVDGNGVVDVQEFEHMTRKLLQIDCLCACVPCRQIYERGGEHNWGGNSEAVLADIAREQEAKETNIFARVGSSPATGAESALAEEAALARRERTLKKDKQRKEAHINAALSSPGASPSATSSPKARTAKIKKSTSKESLASPGSHASPIPSSIKAAPPHMKSKNLHVKATHATSEQAVH